MRGAHRLGTGAVVAAAVVSFSASALGGSPGPMMRGDAGSPNAGASPTNTTLLIHRVGGRRAWSLDGGPFEIHQRVSLARGSTLAVIDGRLVEVSGRRVSIRYIGASTFVAFGRTGVYRFRIGALTVKVSIR